MNRNTARAIERHRLACIPLSTGRWMVGIFFGHPFVSDTTGVVDGQLEMSPVNHFPHVGETLDSAVEDWCNARDLPYERED